MIVVLMSGGIDSWMCLCWAVRKFGKTKVRPVYYDVGQRYAAKEKVAAIRLSAELGLLCRTYTLKELPFKESVDAHIPMRNTFFMLLAAMEESCEGVVFGMLKGESCEDKNPYYVDLMQRLFDSQFKKSIYRKTTHPFHIYVPFANMTKAQALRQHISMCKDLTRNWLVDIYDSVGCFDAKNRSCGACISCYNRWVALTLNALPDEVYEKDHPATWMLHQFFNRKKICEENPSLLSYRQLWLKRSMIFESFRAINRYCRTTRNRSFLDLLLNGETGVL